jgi:cysteine synthase
LVGNTPLIDLSDLVERNGRVKLYAKVESFNPGGSVKDRPGLEIILSAKERRLLTPEKSSLMPPQATWALLIPFLLWA